jgi:hypothetical protein
MNGTVVSLGYEVVEVVVRGRNGSVVTKSYERKHCISRGSVCKFVMCATGMTYNLWTVHWVTIRII